MIKTWWTLPFLLLDHRRLCNCRSMYLIDSLRLILLVQIIRNSSENDENFHLEIITRLEHMNVQFHCDLPDVTWWKRPNLLATRYGFLLPKYHSKMSLERSTAIDEPNKQIFHIYQLQSNDSGVYECETLGGIRQFNLTVLGKRKWNHLRIQTRVFYIRRLLDKKTLDWTRR